MEDINTRQLIQNISLGETKLINDSITSKNTTYSSSQITSQNLLNNGGVYYFSCGGNGANSVAATDPTNMVKLCTFTGEIFDLEIDMFLQQDIGNSANPSYGFRLSKTYKFCGILNGTNNVWQILSPSNIAFDQINNELEVNINGNILSLRVRASYNNPSGFNIVDAPLFRVVDRLAGCNTLDAVGFNFAYPSIFTLVQTQLSSQTPATVFYNQSFSSSGFTPTVTNVSSPAASSINMLWTKNGNIIDCSLYFSISETSYSGALQYTSTLPIPPLLAFTNITSAIGVAVVNPSSTDNSFVSSGGTVTSTQSLSTVTILFPKVVFSLTEGALIIANFKYKIA